jgi:lysozyme
MSYFKEFLSRIWNGLVSAFDLKPLGHWSFWLSVGSFGLNLFFSTDKGAALLSQVTANMTPADGLKLGLALLVAAILTKFVKQATVMGWLKSLSAWLAGFIKANGGGAISRVALTAAGAALLALIGQTAYDEVQKSVPAHEQVVKKGYLDPVGIPTKCAGDTTNVVVGKVYTDEDCQVSLDEGLLAHAAPVLKASPELILHPYILAATIDLTYNIGTGAYRTSTPRKEFAAGNFAAGCAAMSAFNKATFAKRPKRYDCTRKKDGKWLCVLPGLVSRRADNRALCERGL